MRIETGDMSKQENERYESFKPINDKEFKDLVWKLQNPERAQEKWLEGLNKLLKLASEETNKSLETNLLDADGTIRMNAFKKGEGGPYQNEGKLKEDKRFVKEMEEKWSGDSGQKIEEFLLAKEKKHGSLWEKTVAVIFNKVLKSNFVVARASKFDDYAHGIDTIIVDKRTGDIICAFDEVSAAEESEIDKSKSKKVEEKNKKGGVKIDYGITFKDGKLVKEVIDNVPVFSLRLSGKELVEVLQKINFNLQENPEKIELETFDKLVLSMEKQAENLKSQDITEATRKRLENFPESLQKMKNARKEKSEK